MEVTKVCPNCKHDFNPTVGWQKCCTPRCTNAFNQRELRARRRKNRDGGGGGGNGGGGAPLFDDGLFATIGGAVEVGETGSVSDKNRYSVKSDAERKPVVSASRRASRKPSRGGHRAA